MSGGDGPIASIGEVDPSEIQVFIARVAEQAMCYDDMLKFLEPLMDQKGPTLNSDERNLVTAACKYVIESDLKIWRTINVIEGFKKFEDKQEYLSEYKDVVS